MSDRFLICTDLDRTLIPNGPQPESANAREHFAQLVARPEVTLAYVSGRHRALVEKAIYVYQLPHPDFVIGDVGTTIYEVGEDRKWAPLTSWEQEIAGDWGSNSHGDLKKLLRGISDLKLQENRKQNRFKLSYYVPVQSDQHEISTRIRELFEQIGVRASLVWSVDEPAGVGLLDVLPECATKFHAVDALIKQQGFEPGNTIFCGDSGNDIEVLASYIPSVLVANSQSEVRRLAQQLADANGQADRLYIARGDFMGMNGNYAAGILEGIAYYHPDLLKWMENDGSQYNDA